MNTTKLGQILLHGLVASVLVQLGLGDASAETYTLAVPAQYGEQWNLCDFHVISAGTAASAGGAMATMEQEQTGVRVLTSSDSEYTMTFLPAEGGGTLQLETPYRNVFWVRAFFCYWTEGNEERFIEQVTGDLVGGSPNEEHLEGPYDTYIHVALDLCGEEVDFSETTRLQQVMEEAVSADSDAVVEFRSFDADDFENRGEIYYDVINFEGSHRVVGEALRSAFTPADPIEVWYGNRMLHVGDCDQTALFYRVRDVDEAEGDRPEEWGETYTSAYRIYAAPGNDGNIMVGYAASTDTAIINLVGYSGAGTMPIHAAPPPGSDAGLGNTFVLITKGGDGMTLVDLVGSTSGSITLTPGTTPGTMSARFEAFGYDAAGRRRNIIGGFRNVPFP